jgi:hypothetical protein
LKERRQASNGVSEVRVKERGREGSTRQANNEEVEHHGAASANIANDMVAVATAPVRGTVCRRRVRGKVGPV